MNKILKLSAIALLASSTSLMAQSKNFAGASIGISGSMAGVEVEGSTTDSSSATTGSGSFGKITPVPSVDINYGFESGSNFVFGIGASYIPAKVEFGTNAFTDSTNSQRDAVKGEIKDVYSIYVTPTYVINNNSALYAKVGYIHGDLSLSSSSSAITFTKKPSDVEGWSVGIGSKTMLTNNLYLTVEGNYTEFDSITATTTDGETNTNTSSATPKVAQAIIGIGYKF
jgi:opacity protein-like surface antigen